MKKLLWLIFALILSVLLIFSACNNSNNPNDETKIIETDETAKNTEFVNDTEPLQNTELVNDTDSVQDTEFVDDTDAVQDTEPVETTDEHIHVFSDWVMLTNPTCTKTGEELGICICGEKAKRESSKLAHTEVIDNGYPATCTTDGLSDGKHCSICQTVLVEQTVISSKGHDFVEGAFKRPTCTEHGWKEPSECSVCGDLDGETIHLRKTGHSIVDGECINCDYVRMDFTDIDIYISDYGYKALAQFENGEQLQTFYTRLAAISRDFHLNGGTVETDIDAVNMADLNLSIEDTILTITHFRYDAPIYYWLDGGFAYSPTNDNTVASVALTVREAYRDAAIRAKYNEIIYKGAEEFYSVVETEDNIYNTVLAYYDLIINKINYAYDSEGNPEPAAWAHRITGVFSGEGAVCEGYAQTLHLMLTVSKIESIYIGGTAIDGSGKIVGHAWNLVRLDDGEWYWFDATWDDRGGILDEFVSGKSMFAAIASSKDLNGNILSETHYPTINDMFGYYNLPEASEDAFEHENIEEVLTTFTVGENTYQVIGFYQVHLVSSTASSGTAIIPKCVFYNGEFYDVIGTGTMMYHGKLMDNIIYDNYSISELILQDGILAVQGFNNCKLLTTVTIPNSVTKITSNAFADCEKLDTIHYNGTVSEWNQILKGNNWNIGCKTITVYCSDKTIII